jgi:hypothetical protein
MVNPVTGKRQVLKVPMTLELLENEIFPLVPGYEAKARINRLRLIHGVLVKTQPVMIEKPGLDGKIWGMIFIIPKSWKAETRQAFIDLGFEQMDAQNDLGQ